MIVSFKLLRVRAQVHVKKSLTRFIKLRKAGGDWFLAILTYGKLPSFCFICGIIGHEEMFCSKQYEDNTRRYGIWLRASIQNNAQMLTNKWLRNEDGDRLAGKLNVFQEEMAGTSEQSQPGGEQGDHMDVGEWATTNAHGKSNMAVGECATPSMRGKRYMDIGADISVFEITKDGLGKCAKDAGVANRGEDINIKQNEEGIMVGEIMLVLDFTEIMSTLTDIRVVFYRQTVNLVAHSLVRVIGSYLGRQIWTDQVPQCIAAALAYD